ncbi:MAG: hypothetical protein E6Q97_19715 [Desulfurellales bacterium]|nr:MAG: hypothetical protein E6Q97_19715 [Desulfurellales bacterium]
MEKLFLAVFFGLFAHAAAALTLADIRTQVRRNVRDTSADTNFQRYSDAVLTDTINSAQREVVNAVWMLSTDTTFSAAAGTMFYDQPANFLAPLKVAFQKSGTSTRVELTEKSQAGLYSLNQNWESQTGTPIHYYVRQKPDASVKQIGLYPAPAATSLGTVYLTYTYTPDDLSADSDEPFNGAPWLRTYHKVIVDYSTGLLKQIEGKDSDATGYFNFAAAGMNRMKERLGEMPNYNPGMVTGSGTNR